ncbi:hypothetical protein DV711_13135 [Motiliproteus coralliicola]|uniref:Urease accessory protein UreH-like transmembrane domain-containing protein n=1 Tax=Motiliproteus coralliicola TaxID=2283196 RepID=A0A369WEP0_9GAMM|nr:hypothetical protein [Motiliproteus coralliicola]RDE19811.1 hypothetical protein DV711_13135 [Motiliproteus coralliicola]
MEVSTTEATLTLAFGLGLLHALDADHVMAVSGLASGRPGWRSCVAFCRRWAIGHGLTLLFIASLVYLFSLAIPETLSHTAESLVGLMLVVIGGWAIWSLMRQRFTFSFHRHGSRIEHAHWHRHDHIEHPSETVAQQGGETAQDDKSRLKQLSERHSPVLVGMLHGVAGSAPLLVLIPLSRFDSVGHALAYVLLFSVGVVISMLVFGGLMGGAYQTLSRLGQRIVDAARALVALSAVGFGAHLLSGYL